MNAIFLPNAPRHGRAGFRPLYRTESRCPSCDGANWLVGRVSAECARCGTPLPLAPAIEEPIERQ